MKEQSIAIVGSGNVAYHLAHALAKGGFIPEVIVSRNENKGGALAKELGCAYLDDVKKLTSVDIIVLSVSDSAIQIVADRIPDSLRKSAIVCHTSGTTSIDALQSCDKAGIFYPLQTFSRDRKVDYKTIPFCLHGVSDVVDELDTLAHLISDNVYHIDDEERKKLHLAAVMVNNFTNHLLYLAKDLLEKDHIDPKILDPLINETINKIQSMTPLEAQTGPARRKDYNTIERHLELLDQESPLYSIYGLISQSIIKTYHEDS